MVAGQLETTLRSLVISQVARGRVFLFVDGVDECAERQVVDYFLATLGAAAEASKVDLNILISSRRLAFVMVGNSLEIDVDACNRGDIATYVEERLRLGIAAQEPQWAQIQDSIVRNPAAFSYGLF
jgi:hypothetical protein